MAFSQQIKEQVLVACGRHCAICHKFCGIKIELHHIKLLSEGGEDSPENCIPLCFDCHADMRSYDHKHPKGTRYSEKELRMHRDNWYEKAKSNLGTGTVEHLNQDVNTFRIITNDLKPYHPIEFLRNFDFGNGSYKYDEVHPLYILQMKIANEPWIEFFDSDLEGIKCELFEAVNALADAFPNRAFSIIGNRDYMEIPQEWFYQQHDRYNEAVKTLNSCADAVVVAYDKFIRLARKKLGVDI